MPSIYLTLFYLKYSLIIVISLIIIILQILGIASPLSFLSATFFNHIYSFSFLRSRLTLVFSEFFHFFLISVKQNQNLKIYQNIIFPHIFLAKNHFPFSALSEMVAYFNVFVNTQTKKIIFQMLLWITFLYLTSSHTLILPHFSETLIQRLLLLIQLH